MADPQLTVEVQEREIVAIEVRPDSTVVVPAPTQDPISINVGTTVATSSGVTDPLSVIREAAANLSGHRGVRQTGSGLIDYASAADASDFMLFLGITTGAALVGSNATVVTHGTLVEGSWTWTPAQPIYLGVDGVLTQTPNSGWIYVQIVAFAITATEIYVNPQPAIRIN